MNSFTTNYYRNVPHLFLLEGSVRLNVIRQILVSFSERRIFKNMRNMIPVGILQSGLSPNNDLVKTEIEGSVPLGSNILNAVDGGVIVSKPMEHVPLKKLLSRPNTDGVVHSVKEFLARPVLLLSGTFSATDVATSFGYHNCFEAMSTVNMLNSKLRGGYLIKATTHVVLQINANRMQQGRYVLAFMPSGGMATNSLEFQRFYYMHRATACEVTQLRHINVDINCDTQVELIIPYVSNYPGWCYGSSAAGVATGDPGVFFLYPYSPLASVSGSTTASYQVFVYYTDIEITGVGVAQMGRKVTSKVRGDFLKEEAVSDRPISTGLNQLTLAANSFGVIPLLSPFMKISSVVTDALAHMAYTLGWSKPIHCEIQQRVRKECFPYLSVGDSHDIADPLSITMNNSVGVIGGFSQTDQDELSIDFLKSIPAWQKKYAWTTSGTAGTVIDTIAVTTNLVFTINDTKNTLLSWCPVAYLSRMFSFWRGSLVYTFKFTRTEFHSGRLILRYVPFDNFAYTNPGVNTNNKPYMLKAIVDVRECNEFTFIVPFLYTRHWADTADTIGQIYIEILDPLVAPATVSSTVNFDLEISGGKDLEFSGFNAAGPNTGFYPDLKALWPTQPYILQSGLNRPMGVLQSGRTDCSFGEVVIGDASIPDENFEIAAACHGEVVKSLRPLLKRGGLINGASVLLAGNNCTTICSRYLSVGASATGTINGDAQWDPYSLIAPLYASVRGNMRVKALVMSGGLNSATTANRLTALFTIGIGKYAISSSTKIATFFGSTATDFISRYVTSSFGMNSSIEGGVSVQIPQYSNTPALCVGDQMYVTNTSGYSSACSYDKVNVKIGFFDSDGAIPSASPAVYLHRSVGDDFNLACFVSCPCTTVIPTA